MKYNDFLLPPVSSTSICSTDVISVGYNLINDENIYEHSSNISLQKIVRVIFKESTSRVLSIEYNWQ